MTYGNYEVEAVTYPRHFIRLTYRGGPHDRVRTAWGRKAASAIRHLNNLQAAGDEAAIAEYLTLKASNGF